jgi:cell division protein FtsI (penicillin-binding protein 3)/stage V sporulation protein D (sporulation-specific penicillin-binding protein)
VLEDAMDDAIARTRAKGAAAIIMDPYTGEILGMASRPTFDPNSFYKYSPETWNNKAVSMIYEPGSVFKPIVGCMGLTEGIITPNTVFQDNGSIRIADRVIHNWDGEGMGAVPFSEIIKFSINTGMVQLGMMLGADRLIGYAKKFGFGSPTGIDLPGEENGILYDPKMMYEPDVATMAIGQGVAVTPIQVLRAICAIANGGELLQPYIVKKIVAPDGTVLREGEKHVVRNVITPEVASQMRAMMEKVVSEGGGKPAAIKGYRIAGKTGTAEKLAEGGGYAAGQYIASFVGFVPADKPMYAMLVMLDTPQGAFYGSQVSAPIFRDTLQQILVAKGIQPASSEGLPSFEEMNAVASKAESALKKLPEITLLPNGKIKLPDFKGVDMRYTAELLQQGHLRLKPYGSGIAYQQRPAPDTEVDEGTTVEVWFN